MEDANTASISGTVPSRIPLCPTPVLKSCMPSHLIEHLNDPSFLLNEAARLLRPEGILIITTPNIAGLQARILKAEWRSAIFDHLYLFSRKTLRAMLEKAGFEIVAFVTWGGWAAGLKPATLKPLLDRAAKGLGIGDVQAIAARPLRR